MAPAPARVLNQVVQDDIEDLQKLLFLKAMMQYVPKDRHVAVTSRPHQKLPEDEHKSWRRFLDMLCSLCDFKSGGDTVTGLMAQATAEGTIFWLATNGPYRPITNQMYEHLCFILSRLNEPHTVPTLTAIICRRSIGLSSNKVHDYFNNLRRELERIKKDSSMDKTPRGMLVNAEQGIRTEIFSEQTLLQTITQSLEVAAGDHHKLCSAAQEIVSGDISTLVMELGSQTGSRYLNVKHHLCRLRSWQGASHYVAKCSRKFSRQISGARVQLLPPGTFRAAENIELPPNTNQILPWILGPQKQHLVSSFEDKLSFAKGLVEKYRNLSTIGTIIHPEVALAEFAYAKDMDFVFLDRYIGCSKPSCYACDIYLTEHPGSFVRRPNHGNAWFKWYPPRLVSQPDDRPVSNLMWKMAVAVQTDVDATLVGNDLGKRQPFESTSGVETSIRRIHEALLAKRNL